MMHMFASCMYGAREIKLNKIAQLAGYFPYNLIYSFIYVPIYGGLLSRLAPSGMRWLVILEGHTGSNPRWTPPPRRRLDMHRVWVYAISVLGRGPIKVIHHRSWNYVEYGESLMCLFSCKCPTCFNRSNQLSKNKKGQTTSLLNSFRDAPHIQFLREVVDSTLMGIAVFPAVASTGPRTWYRVLAKLGIFNCAPRAP